MSTVSNILQSSKSRISDALGGPARMQVILVLGAVLGLDTADKGTVSAVSDQLKHAFGIGNTEIGLLLAVVSYIGAFATLPMGVLADRVRRRSVLMVAVVAWSAAMIVSGTASSYLYLLFSRFFLGAVTAAAWPCVASLAGDFFPARERAGVFGLILSGELVGAGIGFFIAGEVSSLINWRWAFYTMAAFSIPVAWIIWRYLPEPQRGAQSWLRVGERSAAAAAKPPGRKRPGRNSDTREQELSEVHQVVRDSDVPARKALVLHEDPTRRGWWWALRYMVRLRTYRLLIAASMLAYFFFSGMNAFAMIYFTGHYGLSRGIVSALVFVIGAGAIAGLVLGGWASRKLLDAGHVNARVIVPAAALSVAVPLLGLGIWTDTAWLGLLLITAGAVALSSAIAPIDAARLDILHPRLWGRGESGRMAARSFLEGSAPLIFGATSKLLGGDDTALMWTFLVMLIPTWSATLFVLPARHSYPRDVATAAASVEATKASRAP